MGLQCRSQHQCHTASCGWVYLLIKECRLAIHFKSFTIIPRTLGLAIVGLIDSARIIVHHYNYHHK